MTTNTYTLTSTELKKMREASKLLSYYKDDFTTHFPKQSILLPVGQKLEDVLITDNTISRSVNRYAASTVGEDVTVEASTPQAQEILDSWYRDVAFKSKVTSIARYQSLFGYCVVKVVFNFPDSMKDGEGNVIVAGSTPQQLLKYIDIGIFGADKAIIRRDDYNNVASVSIMIGDTIEEFTNNAITIYKRKPSGDYKLLKRDTNPVAPLPLAIPIFNLETVDSSSGDIASIIHLQEALNVALTSLNQANRYHGFPVYYATGIETQYDANGNPIPMIVGAGMTLTSESVDATFGRLEIPNITPLKESVETISKQIAYATHSLSLLTGEVPSGLALSYMLQDFNSIVAEKQLKIRHFIERLHTTLFKLLSFMTDVDYSDVEFKVYLSGGNPLHKEMQYQQAKELYSLQALSLETLLDNTDVIESTQDELAKLQQSQPKVSDNLLSTLVGD